MRTHLVALPLVCGLAPVLSAQTTNFRTSPDGWLTKEAGRVPGITTNPSRACSEFGSYPEYETQIFDATTRGKNLQLIKQLDYRLDFRSNHASEARKWASVTLDMGTGRYDKATTNFATNYLTPPTRVFSGAVSWPAVQGQVHTNEPCPWGVEVSFPFQSSWPQTNTDDTIHHFKFSGGVLGNSGKWDQDTPNNYVLDAAFINEASTGYQFPYNVGAGCIDSGQTAACNAYCYVATYSKDSFSNADSYRLDLGIFNGGKNVLHARVLSTGRANVPFPGVTCNNLGVDLTQPFFLDFVTTNNTGYHRQIRNLPYIGAVAGVRLHFQVAWNDTVTNQLMLARPNLLQLPEQSPGLMSVVYQIGTKAAAYNQAMQRIPLTRYTYQ